MRNQRMFTVCIHLIVGVDTMSLMKPWEIYADFIK